MRFHLVVTIYVLTFSSILQISKVEYAVVLITIALVIGAEAINTSIEKLCDFSCDKYNEKIGIVKDISAGAVLVVSICAVFVGAFILYKPSQLLNIFFAIFGNPYLIVLLLFSLIVSLVFISLGPNGIKAIINSKKERKSK